MSKLFLNENLLILKARRMKVVSKTCKGFVFINIFIAVRTMVCSDLIKVKSLRILGTVMNMQSRNAGFQKGFMSQIHKTTNIRRIHEYNYQSPIYTYCMLRMVTLFEFIIYSEIR